MDANYAIDVKPEEVSANRDLPVSRASGRDPSTPRRIRERHPWRCGSMFPRPIGKPRRLLQRPYMVGLEGALRPRITLLRVCSEVRPVFQLSVRQQRLQSATCWFCPRWCSRYASSMQSSDSEVAERRCSDGLAISAASELRVSDWWAESGTGV
ncbi:hypothetical protein M8818_002253 [Zalaria obscura]|uniref:Uncharacterized protein n=1 Tax=Zalaria obscura TaxID=2024903 RepID=A0ACC3SMT6_9PEZI